MTEIEEKKQDLKKTPRFFSIGLGEEKKYFIENLSTLIGSGVNLDSALEIIKKDTKSSRLRRIVQFIEDQISEGSSLWQALEWSKMLAPRYISLVRIGEKTGRIVENLDLVAAQEQKEGEFRAKVRSAMLYPTLVLTLALVLGLGISWFILPRLASVFSQMKLKLPLATRILINIGKFFALQGKIAVPAFFVLLAVVIYFLFFSKKTKFIGQAFLFGLPGVGKLMKETELARFGYLSGTLLGAGIPIVEALGSLEEATEFQKYKKLYGHLRQGAEEGHTFVQSFATYHRSKNLIGLPVQHLLAAAEQSGRLPQILLKIGERFEAKIDITTKNLATILEPILLIVVWLGVVFIALAIILPIYSMIGGLNK